MKSAAQQKNRYTVTSLPVRGAWIEIFEVFCKKIAHLSLPVRGAWIEMLTPPSPPRKRWSLPVRGAWIEITLTA